MRQGWLLVAGLALAAGSHSSAATTITVAPGEGEAFRAVYANAADVAEGKKVAQRVCAACHGLNGVSTTKGIPNLAGQRPVYLYQELRVYREGGRGKSAMSRAVQYLSDDAFYKVAAYYASLEPAQPSIKGRAKAEPDPVAAGKAAAASCAGCHGENGVSQTPGTPSLAGLDPQYLVKAMEEYKSGARKNDTMQPMVAALTPADMSDIALYYGLQKPARSTTPAKGDAAAGKAAAAACAGCHGENGVSASAENPSLAGQDPKYLAEALHAYKGGARANDTMKGLAETLDDAGIANLSAYYAGEPPQAAKVRKPLTTAEWAQRCDRCHGVNGNSVDPRLPALAAQREEYLEKVLRAYQKGERKSPQMAAMSSQLTEADVRSLAAHYASQRARAAVYIVLPSR